jgi:transposase
MRAAYFPILSMPSNETGETVRIDALVDPHDAPIGKRRRHWPIAEKLRILSEALAPGATIARIADRNGVCRSRIYAWLRLARTDRLPGISVSPQAGHFVPARIEALQNASASGCQPRLPSPAFDTGSTVPSRGRRAKMVEVVQRVHIICSVTSRRIPTIRRGPWLGLLPPGADGRRAPRHARARRPLPPRPRQGLLPRSQSPPSSGTPLHGDGDVPRNGYEVLVAAGESGGASTGLVPPRPAFG